MDHHAAIASKPLNAEVPCARIKALLGLRDLVQSRCMLL
jgi:hypothetical protein